VVQPAAAGHGPLELSIQPDPEDSAVARELGWTRGIPGAEVTISPGVEDTTMHATGVPVAVLQTDSAGRVSVSDLPDGTYLIEVRRPLSLDESAGLGSGQDVAGFVAKSLVARGSGAVFVPASHRRSVVISEWAFSPIWVPDAGYWYYWAGYLELTNNSDTTVYLDGLVIGEAYALASEIRPGACAASETATNDPDGLWSKYMDSLPGTGHDHPLAPGATAVIATDAIDHSGISPQGLDLSHADFEFIGTGDVDNPSVPNTVGIGLEAYRDGHGLYLNEILEEVTFVALPLDVSALPMAPGHDYVRVPRSKVLDVVAQLSSYAFSRPTCPHLVNQNFDRARGRFGPLGGSTGGNPQGLYSVQRKVVYTRPDGRIILQHTRSTEADFFRGVRSPRALP